MSLNLQKIFTVKLYKRKKKHFNIYTYKEIQQTKKQYTKKEQQTSPRLRSSENLKY